ncbi:MAG: hypothetical protein JNJ43_06090 [Anaerolineales bacterium]|nr:hypothetical protein [Anaerolineales bacterium]
MKPNPFSGNLSFLIFAMIVIVSFLIVIILMILGPIIGNTFSEINSSLSPAITQEVSPTGIATNPSVDEPISEGVLLETRRLTLEFPPKIKADSASDIIRLTLEVDDLGNVTPTAYYETNTITGEVIQIPDLYETHNVGVEANFDIAGVDVKPSGITYQPLQKGKSVTFYWSIRAPQVGKFRGTIWVHLVFVDKLTGEESRRAVSAQIVEIEAVDFFGFSVNFVRTSGVVGSVLGIIVGFPFFDDIVKYWWNKRKKRKVKK